MGWLNDIKNKITNLLNRGKTKRLPEGQANYTKYTENLHNSNNQHVLTRRDGSTLEIEPALDEIGNQTYEQVFNRGTGKFQAIPKFKIMSEELKDIIDPQILHHTILMDINPQLLNNPQYADFIANSLLSAERMNKVVWEYENYAGTIQQYPNGQLTKTIDPGIVRTLKDTRVNNAIIAENAYKERVAKERQDAIDKAGWFEYGTAQDLSKENNVR